MRQWRFAVAREMTLLLVKSHGCWTTSQSQPPQPKSSLAPAPPATKKWGPSTMGGVCLKDVIIIMPCTPLLSVMTLLESLPSLGVY